MRDTLLHQSPHFTSATAQARSYCPCETMDSEDPLFILYTSGSTGKPKGVAHTTGGYMVNAAMTTDKTFDLRVSRTKPHPILVLTLALISHLAV